MLAITIRSTDQLESTARCDAAKKPFQNAERAMVGGCFERNRRVARFIAFAHTTVAHNAFYLSLFRRPPVLRGRHEERAF